MLYIASKGELNCKNNVLLLNMKKLHFPDSGRNQLLPSVARAMRLWIVVIAIKTLTLSKSVDKSNRILQDAWPLNYNSLTLKLLVVVRVSVIRTCATKSSQLQSTDTSFETSENVYLDRQANRFPVHQTNVWSLFSQLQACRWLFTYEQFLAIEISLRKQLQEDSKWIVTHRVRIFCESRLDNFCINASPWQYTSKHLNS